MAIDHPHGGGDSEEFSARARMHKNCERLSEMGIRVKDATLRRQPRYMMPPMKIQYHDRNVPIDSTVIQDVDYVGVYELEMREGYVRDFLGMADKLSSMERRMYEGEQMHANTQTELRRQRTTTQKLRDTLRDNPGIRDQWDELMIQLKMAGFDDYIA